jgi:hypothetical protein
MVSEKDTFDAMDDAKKAINRVLVESNTLYAVKNSHPSKYYVICPQDKECNFKISVNKQFYIVW